ncbi:MAG: hypothetical protein GWN58_23685 [Anaerolineae bacterium]|nr:hypothetical protein [Anaerolineae bacterium]
MSIRNRFATALEQINLEQLVGEIQALGLPLAIEGVADYLDLDGEIAVDTESELSPEQISAVQAIIDAHVAVDYAQRQIDADAAAANIPNWATWSEDQALTWFDANVVDLASARTVLRAVVQMVLAMRNKLWPGLEGS